MSQQSFLNSPTVITTSPLVLPPTFTFGLSTNGFFTQSPAGGGSPALLTGGGNATLQGQLTTIFTNTYYFATDSSTLTPTSGTFPSGRVEGSYYATMTGSVSGNPNSTLTGSATMQSSYISAAYTVSNSYTILVTIDPSGLITYRYSGGVFHASAIAGTSAGEGSASPLPASTSETSGPTMTMAASNSSTLLAAAPASAGDAAVSPPTTLDTSGFKATAGTHRRFGLRRDFYSPQDHHGRFEPSRTTTLDTPNPVSTISRTAPMAGHCQRGTPGPMNLGFTLTSTITDPDVPIPSARAGAVTGTPGGSKTGLTQPLTALKAKYPPAVAGTVPHQTSPER